MTPRVLFLFTKTEMAKAGELKDVLQAKLREAFNLEDMRDVIAEDSNLKEAVGQSRCIVLIYSQQCKEYLNEGTKEIDDGNVVFDGFFIKENAISKKTLVVHFGYEPGEWISTRAGGVFKLNPNSFKSDATVDYLVDTIRGTTPVK